MFTVPISPAVITRCSKFAEDVYETNKDEYAKRGQGDKDVVINQIGYGKIAECAADIYENGEILTVDFEIYEARAKGWGPDIINNNSRERIGVKSIYRKGYFGTNSWTIQDRDGLLVDSVLLTRVYSRYVEIVAKLPRDDVRPLLRPMIKLSLRDNKQALYLRDVPEEYLIEDEKQQLELF